ncbi:MAG: hypothetical protein AB7L84_11285 [Acidimicrobiia bacterium]
MESGPVASGGAGVDEAVRGRFLALDERGVGLRATWRPDRGFVNLSLWRGDRCVETFHLRPEDVGELVSFLVSRLASAVPAPPPPLRVVDPDETAPPPPSRTRRLRAGAARVLAAVGRHLDH